MKLLIYRLAYPILWCISKLPWPLFYIFSDFIFLILYYLIRYRRKVVTSNLKLAFPEKSNTEIGKIKRKFYRHFVDIFFEMIKSISISESEIQKRFKIKNIAGFRAIESQNKSIVGMYAHYASYEWSNSINLSSNYQCVGIYKKIQNPYFDALLQKIRARFDSPLIESKKVFRQIAKDKIAGRLRMYGMISDQSPKLQNALYWTPFLGIMSPVFMGTEVLARRLDIPVYYMKITKVKRGFYEGEIIPIATKPKEVPEYYIVNTYTKMLEAQILEEPAYYLWTHKRFKHHVSTRPERAVVNKNML